MEVEDLLKVARIVQAAGTVQGRVKLQKIIYLLLQKGYALPFDDFVIRQHGPFSRKLASATDSLTSVGVLTEHAVEQGARRGRLIRRYDYEVDSKYQSLVKKVARVMQKKGGRASMKIASQLAGEDRKVLEVAATIVFLKREEGLSGQKLDKTLSSLKGHLRGSFRPARELLKQHALS